MANSTALKQYVDFTKPNTVPVDVTITIKEGRASVKALKRTESSLCSSSRISINRRSSILLDDHYFT